MSTPLRQKLIEDLQLHGLSSRTQEVYVVAVRQLAEHYGKSPDQISEEELRQYFLYLSQVRKVSPSTFQIALSAIKFFFEYTLQRQWATLELVRPTREKKLPVVLSVEEVSRVLACVHRARYRVCLSAIYACGLRLHEGIHLLPVPYFLLTSTLPAGLRELARRQPRLIYDLLLRMSAEATQKLARDPRFVGGQVGLVGVLHSWGRNLAYHPHVHYLVPAGGLAADGKTWLPACQKFLLPVKALSRIFRAKMRQALRKIDVDGLIPPEVWRQNWVVHCKAAGSGQLALKYLAPYIFRVAISNRRILKLEDERVTFRYRATDTGQERLCTLAAEEFIHRFLQHVLPKGFVKVRYYGFFSAGSRPRLIVIRQQLDQKPICVDEAQPGQTRETLPQSEKVHLCLVCGRPMQPGDPILPAKGRSPP